jgi:uncharacterized protein
MKAAAKNSRLKEQALTLPDLSWYSVVQDKNQRSAIIQSLCQQIAQQFHPEKIILFGSQASGQATPDSDIDLLVIMPFDGHPLTQSAQMLKQLNLMLPIDLLVSTPRHIEQRLAIDDTFIRAILENGIVLYETHHAGMDRKS